MEQIRPYTDSRLAGQCVYCGGVPDTGDHVPPRAFLDEPYPENLPKVPCCKACNEGASLDEEYVASLLEVAACGTAQPDELERPKIVRKLRESGALRRRLERCLTASDGQVAVVAEADRVSHVIEKIGRALWAFELGEPTAALTADVWFAAIPALDSEALAKFTLIEASDVFPEVGSRLMFRHLVVNDELYCPAWQDVQPGRFSYAIQLSGGGGTVKMIIRDYLAGRVEFS